MAEESPLERAAGELAGLRRMDFCLLAAFCLLLFGYSLFGGQPLTLHEARQPECSREMQANHDWLIPRSGGRPWLERPPLPQWGTILISDLLGQSCDRVWVVRLPSVLAGGGVVLLVAWLAAGWFGRGIGICSGLVLATGYEFYRYATLAEEDIQLAFWVTLAVALFARMEFEPGGVNRDSPAPGFFGPRPWRVMAFFLVMGLTNLVKGPLVGTGLILAAIGSFLLWNWDGRSIRRWVWMWGGLAFAGLAAFWPWVVHHRYPSVWDNWKFDYHDTKQYDNPLWYYLPTLLWVLAPWTPAALVGLWKTARAAWQKPGSPQRFLWCWAIVPVVLLSLAHRKHHHYLVPVLAPWAIVAALGLREIAQALFRLPARLRRPTIGVLVYGLPGAVAIGVLLWVLRHKISSPTPVIAALMFVWVLCVAMFYQGLWQRKASLLLGAWVVGIFVAACWGQSYLPDENIPDTLFFQQVESMAPHDCPLFIIADYNGELDFFRETFYLPSSARLLHNLTFLRDQQIKNSQVYVVARRRDQAALESLGSVRLLLSSAHTRRETSAADRFTLFELRYRLDLRDIPRLFRTK